MKFNINGAFVTLSVMAIGANASAQFAGGTLAVTQVGDGTGTSLTSVATAAFLDDFSVGGTLLYSDAMPTAVNGSNLISTNSGSATSELQLNLFGNGSGLTLGGYNDAVGQSGVASSSVARVLDSVSLGGAVDSSTSIGTLFSGNNVRSVWSPDGNSFYAGGPLGLVYDAYGASTGTQLLSSSSGPINVRQVEGYGGNIYFTTSTSGKVGLWEISGMPTSGIQTPTQVISESSGSPYDFLFANNGNTLYMADDGIGIQKWTYNGSAWSLAYTGTFGGFVGVRSLTTDGANIYGIGATTATGPDDLIMTTDTGTGFSAATTLATPGTDINFRGVRYIPGSAPEPAAVLGLAVGFLGLIARRRSRR